ncbi:hypothetical protein ACIPUD_26960 [Bradyrhizobium sp. CAR08]
MAAVARVRKSSLHNALEGLALTATLQSFPTFAAAAFLLKLVGITTWSAIPASPSSSSSSRSPMRCLQ